MVDFYLKSFAKLNLSLNISGRDVTGLHFIDTIMCIAKDYYDEIFISRSHAFEVSTFGNYSVIEGNILFKVVDLCKKYFGNSFNANFEVRIKKNIKTGAGLGGGSSNAAEFLKFLLKQNNIWLNKNAFCELALQIGADISFFYDYSIKRCTGYGEILNEVSFIIPSNLHAIIILPDFEIETKKAFSLIENFNQNIPYDFEDVLKNQNSFYSVCSKIQPEIENIIQNLHSLPHVLKADVSGSGSACFALFSSKEDAIVASKNLTSKLFVISEIIS